MSRGTRTLWALGALGLVGSLLIAYAGPRAVDTPTVTWWYSSGANIWLVYTGMALLSLAWLGLWRGLATRPVPSSPGRQTGPRSGVPPPSRPSRSVLLIIGGLWLAPLALGPALFSRDVYSYLAQGTLLNLGRNPYHATPALLAQLGRTHVLNAVSQFWRHTPAPYGPVFLGLVDVIVAITGSHLIAGVLMVRALDLIGTALLVVFVPRISRALGSDELRATWLIFSPLALLELIAAGHNDVLMTGLLVAGVALALEGKPLGGVALCALAATIKVPAMAGAAFIAVAWARAENGPRAQARFLATGAVVGVGVLAVVSAASGLGVSWLTSSVFSTPARVHLAITPGTAIGYTVAAVARDGGLGIATHTAESAFGLVFAAITVAIVLVLLYRVRIATVVPGLGMALVVAAAGGPAAWPWYFTWGLALLIACRGPQRSLALALALALSPFLVKPDGILALPIHTAPVVVVAYVAIAVAVLQTRRLRGGDPGIRGGSDPSLVDPALPALNRS